MEPRNPDYKAYVTSVFREAQFVQELGIELVDLGPGWVRSRLVVKEKHKQQHGFVHAGVQATIADHTAGAAADTLVAADETVLSVEFKINLLRPAIARQIVCDSRVIKPGRRLSIVESRVWADQPDTGKLVSLAQLTMAVVPQSQVGG